MLTMKFGGTSMGSPEMIQNVAKILRNTKEDGRQPIVVVSAMSGVTNKLLEAASIAEKGGASEERQKIINHLRYQHVEAAKVLIRDEYIRRKLEVYINDKINHFREFLFAVAILQEITARSHDEIVSLGEKLSAALLAAYLQDTGEQSIFVDLSNIVEKSAPPSNSNVFFEYVEQQLKKKVDPFLKKGSIPVLTGFFGQIPDGIVNAVGRGYSDFTAALSGAAFSVREIQIWTDVDGFLSADPRIVPETCVLPEISFEEAAELAEFGAKVLHPQTIWPAVKKNIPVRIKNTMNPSAIGTLITKKGVSGKYICKSVARKKGVSLITISTPRMLMAVGFLADVASIFKKHNISIGFLSSGEISLTMTINGTPPPHLLSDLRQFCRVDISEHHAIVCAVGSELTQEKGVIATIFGIVAKEGIIARAISASAHKINVSMVVAEKDADATLLSLHKGIFEKGE